MLSVSAGHRLRVLGFLILVYISWGSGFIGIRFAVERIPPFLMCGARMLLAGVLLYLITWLRGERNSPDVGDWLHGSVLAFFMVFISSGVLSWAQAGMSSGTAALIMGSVPIWMILSGWLTGMEPRPTGGQALGLIGGFAGLFLLAVHQGAAAESSPIALFCVWLAALGWVAGSLYSKRLGGRTGLSLFRSSAWIMLLGGVQCLIWALISGEWSAFQPENLTPRALFAFGYMVAAGSIVGYSCYFWLLVHTRTEVAVSYEYVDPVIAVFLGWLLAGETVDGVMLTACALTVGSVFLLISKSR